LILINSNYCRRARVQQHIDGVVGEVKTPKRVVWSRVGRSALGDELAYSLLHNGRSAQ